MNGAVGSAWLAFRSTVIQPRQTFVDLEREKHPGRDGALVLLFVPVVHTLILVVLHPFV